ncbi:sensor histidine kinase [Eubacterium oxidoreducens]|uniref:histidine kinase n=1 Tax=Eubacterium oxidoreducens TaxID=1732 RepID=A0A1G6AFH0_EUBOX|nr:ATP-binding protein [Eubacterium oxidoreducens]SDB07125.1 hypothetical protein SAMN02910417_00519 [Eubacterium oxidoreducens]
MVIRSKQRFIAIMVMILVAVVVCMLVIIYYSTQVKVDHENKEMLEMFATCYEENGLPQGDFDPAADITKESDSDDENRAQIADNDFFHRYQVATFYAVVFDSNNNVEELLNDAPTSHSDEELEQVAQKLLEAGQEYGTTGEIVYLVTKQDDYVLVTMMDNSVVGDMIKTLMRTMILFGTIAVIILIVFSALLGNWVMKPIEESYNRQKQFISNAGHELKTPITTIGTNVELLKRQIGKNEWLENVEYENKRMSMLVHQMLDLARLEQVRVQMEEVDFSKLSLAAILPFEAIAFEKNVRLTYDIPEGIKLKGERQMLEQLVSILTDNAINHCFCHGCVEIKLWESKGRTSLKVTNDGKAIESKEQEHIFERFYRGDEARVDFSGHYGLGLAIAKAVVMQHHGDIKIECGEGRVSFIVEL